MRDGVPLLVVAAMILLALSGCVGGGGDQASAGDGPGSDDLPDGGEGPGGNGTQATGSGPRPHVHDRWDGQETRTLVDREIPVEAVTRDEPLLLRSCEHSGRNVCYGSAKFSPSAGGGERTIVPPGTDRIEVTIGFSESDFEGLRLWWKTRMADGDCLNSWSCRAILESGTTFEINITDVRQTDDGHASVSAWRFIIDAWGNPSGQNTVGPLPRVNYGEGDVDVEMVAHRVDGDLPLEPPHPEFWSDTDIYRIGYLDGSTDGMVQAGNAYAEPQPPEGACPTRYQNACVPAGIGKGILWDIAPGQLGERTRSQQDPDRLNGTHPIALVPPKTSVIAAAVEVDGDAARPIEVCLDGYYSPEEPPDRIGCETFDGGTGSVEWDHPIDDDKVDSFYADNWGANQSRWRFRVRLSATQQGPTFSATSFSGSVEVGILAVKPNMYTMPDWTLSAPS